MSAAALPAVAALPLLAGPRLRLRQLQAADLPALFAVFSDPAVMRYWSHPPFATPDDARWYLADIEAGRVNRTLWQWGIARNEDDAVIGTVTVYAVDAGNRRAEIGYALGSAHWRRGYAEEALRAVLAHAFGPLGLARIEADIDPRNGPSCRLVEKLGFRCEGLLRERWYVGGEFAHSALYGLLAREFAGRAPG